MIELMLPPDAKFVFWNTPQASYIEPKFGDTIWFENDPVIFAAAACGCWAAEIVKQEENQDCEDWETRAEFAKKQHGAWLSVVCGAPLSKVTIVAYDAKKAGEK